MTRMNRPLFLLGALGVLASMARNPCRAADQLPGAPQLTPILISGADVYTVSGDVIRGGQVLFDEGRIVAVGKDVQVPSNTKHVDVTGKRVYPGLFAAGNDLGLVEVRSVRGSDDASETGTLNPNIRAEVAINPDSELIPVARANGVLLNLTLPEGSILPGSSAVLQLDGWTWQDLTLKAPAAIHVTWPSMTRPRARRVTQRQNAEETPKADEELRSLDQAFADARAYLAAKNSPKKPEHDARWEAIWAHRDPQARKRARAGAAALPLPGSVGKKGPPKPAGFVSFFHRRDRRETNPTIGIPPGVQSTL